MLRSPPGSVRVGGRARSASRAGQALAAVSLLVQLVPSAFILAGDGIASGTENYMQDQTKSSYFRDAIHDCRHDDQKVQIAVRVKVAAAVGAED